MCSCGHAADDHHPKGRCLRCHRDCPGAKQRLSRYDEGWTEPRWGERGS